MGLKERLSKGEYLIGAGIFTVSADVIEYACRGLDWIWLEGQHAHASWPEMTHCVRAAAAIGVPVLARTWTHDGGTIERLLDMGVEGIIVPMVDTPEQARAIVSHCYYPPAGNRSYGGLRPEIITADTEEWNRRMVVVVQIESPQGMANAEAIARVEGVDALHIGLRDLAMRMGLVSTEYNVHELMKDELRALVGICRRTGKAAVAVALTEPAMAQCLREGYRLICAGMDVDHLEADYRRMRGTFKRVRTDLTNEGFA